MRNFLMDITLPLLNFSDRDFEKYIEEIRKSNIDRQIQNELKDLLKCTNEKIADAVIKNRDGKIKIKPGYDGVYGELVFDDAEEKDKKESKIKKQKSLGEFI